MFHPPRVAAGTIAVLKRSIFARRLHAPVMRFLLSLILTAGLALLALVAARSAESAFFQQPQQDPFRLAGRVVTTVGAPVDGVTIAFSRVSGEGALPAAVQTDANGNWSQTGFRAGTIYRATPAKSGVVFNPASRDAGNSIGDLDFQATTDPFAVSGRAITTLGAPVAGATIAFTRVSGNGDIPLPAQTDAGGNWSQTGFRAGTVYRATPGQAGMVFTPAAQDFAGPVGGITFQSRPEPFSVSGRALNSAGGALNGVAISFALVSGGGDLPSPVATDADGNWRQTGFRVGSVYRITPSRIGFVFIPPSFDVSGALDEVKFIGEPGSTPPPPPPPPTDDRPVLRITSPPNGAIINTQTLSVRGTVNPANAQVTVNGVQAVVTSGQFVADGVSLPREGNNLVTAIGTAANGTSQASIVVALDLTPPTIIIDSPPSGFTTADETIAVAGMVTDVITPNPTVRVNGVDAQVSNGNFIAMGVKLNPGQNQITAAARDAIGNTGTAVVTVTRAAQPGLRLLIETGQAQSGDVNAVLPTPLGVRLIDGDGAAVANREILFHVARGDGSLKNAPPQPNQMAERNLRLRTDNNGRAAAQFTLGSRTGAGNNRVQATVAGGLSFVEFCATAASGKPDRITIIPMSDQQTGETNRPLAEAFVAVVSDLQGNGVAGAQVTFRVTEGGGNLGGNPTQAVTTDSLGFARALLTLGPTPGTLNNAVAANFQGQTDPPVVFSASARVPGPPANTSFTGLVLDNGDRPLRNARAIILGSNRSALTDAEGRFTIAGIPPGAQRLFIEGAPIVDSLGRIFPDLEFDVNVISGVQNSLTTPIYLPPLSVDPQSVVTIRGPVTTQITLRMPGVPEGTLTLLPGTIVSNAAGPASAANPITVRLSRVNNDRVPMPPPNGSLFMLAGTVQPAGTHFDPPAAICVPNAGMPPGAQVDIFSFDHDVGQFLSIGMATVSEDGSILCSNPGFGIQKAGWWGCSPPRPPTTDPKNCRATVTASSTMVCIGDRVTFTASTDPAGGSVNFSGDMGDSPSRSGNTLTTSFSTPGRKTVTVSCGQTSNSVTVDVLEVTRVTVERPMNRMTFCVGERGDFTAHLSMPKAGISITFEVINLMDNSVFDRATRTTDAQGQAKLTLEATTPGRYNIRARCGSESQPPFFGPVQVVRLMEAQAKRNDEADTIFSKDPGRFCVGNQIDGRLKSEPDMPLSDPIKWELRLTGFFSDTVKSRGNGSAFAGQMLDEKGTWKLIFYCDSNGNGQFDGGILNSEPNVQTSNFEVHEITMVSLTVVRHVSVPFTDAQVDGIFAAANTSLRRRDRASTTQDQDDVRCCVELRRSGSIGTFGGPGGPPAIIQIQADQDAVFAVSGNIKIVAAINFCGMSVAANGCTIQGRRNSIMVPAATTSAWAHEFGHAQGIDGDYMDAARSHRIMFFQDLGGNTVDPDECDRFRRP